MLAVSSPPILDVIEPATAERLMSRGSRRTFARGSWLFHEGDPAERVWIVTEGIVKVQKVSEAGRVTVMGFRERGCILGELSALDGDPMSAGATALVETQAVVITRAHFLDTVSSSPDLAMALLDQTNRRLRQTSRLMHDIATADAVTRVANRLIDLTAETITDDGLPTTVDLPVSQQDLAEWSGLSREAVVRALRVLRDAGAIETGRRSVVILDHAELSHHGEVDLPT